MRNLSLILFFLFLVIGVAGQENPHGESLKVDCADCHTTQGWKVIKTSGFDHDKTSFALEGQHKYTDCSGCHISLVFSDAKSGCINCHEDLHHTTVGPDCAICHTADSWIVENITEIHQMSRFPLLGAHNTADCSECHTSASQLEFEPLGVECVDCHLEDYQATTDPNHVQTGLSTECIECHGIEAVEWSVLGVNHAFFPLTNGHDIKDCNVCHIPGSTEPLSPECYSCHQVKYNEAENHTLLGYPFDCELCHNTTVWEESSFYHDQTGFPLTGAHAVTVCSACHETGFPGTPSDCKACHANEYNQAKDHVALGYPADCLLCHNTNTWDESTFDHNATGLPLAGAHKTAECMACHTSGYTGTPTECYACHSGKYDGAVDPNHTAAGISTVCETCHGFTSWSPSTFNHQTTSGFPLTYGHSGMQCSVCHQGTTSGASSDCISCHQQNYNTANNHVDQNYPFDCTVCHDTKNWGNLIFDHNATAFPLTGSHLATECVACHSTGYSNIPTACNACHAREYNDAQNPNHAAAGISTECETCHKTTVWTSSTFDHGTVTGFPLTNGHDLNQCSDCHQGTTSGVSSDCISCHQSNYNSAKDHVAQNFPFDCLLCHNTSNWKNIIFDHNATAFPLSGAHVATECIACHSQGYTGTSSLCYDCHRTDYTNAQDPNHVTANLSTSCEECHNENAWVPSTLDHDGKYFPIYSGRHDGVWSNCIDCHTNSSNYAVFSCTGCHEHNQVLMYLSHSRVEDYAYISQRCLDCHPDGRRR